MTPLEDRPIEDMARQRGEMRSVVEARYRVAKPWRADRDAAAKAHGYDGELEEPR